MNVKSVLMQWSKLGAAFNIKAANTTPDIEQLLIDTAMVLPQNARLFPVAVTWLCKNYRLVCRHRLAGLAARIDDPQTSAALGLLLDTVKSKIDIDHFNIVIKKCKTFKEPQPLFEVDRTNRKLAAMAKTTSCELGIKWGLWSPEPQLKEDTLKPTDWIMNENTKLINRAIFNGNLRASILETLTYDKQAGQSESALARYCGVTRKALRDALDHLEFCRMITRSSIAGKTKIMIP
ncbi:MAG: hypothetical protein FVQ82_11055 [Planctomycetes bacterium]|nr:hypothetical protein [Planctomycetota bacterium]